MGPIWDKFVRNVLKIRNSVCSIEKLENFQKFSQLIFNNEMKTNVFVFIKCLLLYCIFNKLKTFQIHMLLLTNQQIIINK